MLDQAVVLIHEEQACFLDFEVLAKGLHELMYPKGEELVLKDDDAPKETRGRGARCYSAPTLSAVQDWLRRKKHLELLIFRDTFFQNTGDYYCRLIRLSDGLARQLRKESTTGIHHIMLRGINRQDTVCKRNASNHMTM